MTNTTRVIAISTPNDNGLNRDWSRYRTSVAAIEQAMGLDLLSNVAGSTQTSLEARVDTGPTQ